MCLLPLPILLLLQNFVACELIILTDVNGRARNIFEVKSLNIALSVSKGRLVCVYPYL